MKLWTSVFMIGIGFTIGLLCGLVIQLPVVSLPAARDSPGLVRARRGLLQDSDNLSKLGKHGDMGTNDTPNQNTRSENHGGISAGSANKQTGQSDLTDNAHGSSAVHNPHDNRYNVLISEKSPHFNALNKYPNKDSDSVVFVNPLEQKLVLNKNVNNGSDANLPRSAHGVDGQIARDVIHDRDANAAHPESNVHRSERLASSLGNSKSGRLGDDSLLKDKVSSGSDIIQGIYWGHSVESACPKGFTRDEHDQWKAKSLNQKFVKADEGCGRMQNRILTFVDSEKSCARYRLNVDQIQGEIYSYYLSKLLGVNNVPPSTLHLADTNKDQWRMVSQEVANAKWSEEKPVILSKWIDGLEPAYIPVEFRNLSKVFQPKDVLSDFGINPTKVAGVIVSANTGSSICDLLQWSDLIVFDYLTANLDRVVNNLFNLQWNDRMMSKPAHNLERGSSGNLVFLDNESGLFHGYRLLDKYSSYHDSLLNSVCVFRRKTIDSIRRLVETGNIADELQSAFEVNEDLHMYVPRIPVKNIKILKQRMFNVLDRVKVCESQNM